jgi:hypothetical protein
MMATEVRVSMSLDCAEFVDRPPRARAALTNGSLLPAGVDGRSATARRFRDLLAQLSREVGNGEALSVREQALIRQAAAIMVRIEALQASIVSGDPVDDDAIVRLSNVAHRLLSAVASAHKQQATKPPSVEAWSLVEANIGRKWNTQDLDGLSLEELARLYRHELCTQSRQTPGPKS